MLDPQGSMSRADISRVHRYRPLEVERDVRDYLRDAPRRDAPSGVRYRRQGGLEQLPVCRPEAGREFRVSASVA